MYKRGGSLMEGFLKRISHDVTAFMKVFDSIKDLVFLMETCEDTFRYVYVNKSALEVLNYDENILGRKIEDVVPKDLSNILIIKYREVIATRKSLDFESKIDTPNGEFIGEASLNPIVIDGSQCRYVLGIVRNITERKNLRDKLAKMAFYDYLTSLPNRRSFDGQLDIAIHQAELMNKKVAIMLLDGRDFKLINDTYGHDAGDAAIKEMAIRLQKCVRQTDTVARLGGDEIGIILPALDTVELAEQIAKRMILSFAKPLHFNEYKIKLEAGIGIAFYPQHSLDKKQLLKHADDALYHAKKSVRSDYIIYSSPKFYES
jgi:diguanylate cyclase (GGDEF)-like protein/PAS domain S-box-containing protein